MGVGDLVRTIFGRPPLGDGPNKVGIVVEVIDHVEVPLVVKVMWPDGSVEKDWSDELEVVNESR